MTPRSIWRLIADSQLPIVKIGKKQTRIRWVDLEQLLTPKRR